MNDLYIGLDLGTSGIKMIAIDESHKVVATSSEHYSNSMAEGCCEIDPEVWYRNMMDGLHVILNNIDDKKRVKAIGVTGQMHSIVFLDDNGKSIRPAILWNDTRTKDLIPGMKEKFKKFEFGEYLSKTISTGSPAAALLWMKKNEPENFKKIKKFLIAPDYLVYRLTGQVCSDYVDASTSCLFDIKKKEWSEEVREYLNLSKDAYPKLQGAGEAAGYLKKEIADQLGISEKTVVLTATGDNSATAVATGCIGTNIPVISLGTSGVVIASFPSVSDEQIGKVILFSEDGKKFHYLIQGTVQSNGSTINWWTKKMMELKTFGNLEKMIADDADAGTALMFYPHIMGEKTLYADPELRGAFLNVSIDDRKEDFLYAIFEGLCFAFHELTDKMNIDLKDVAAIKVMGGGSANATWMQLLSDVFQKKVEQLSRNIAPSLGAALLAEGHVRDKEGNTENDQKVNRVFSPRKNREEYFERKYKKYLQIHDHLQFLK